MVKCCIFNSLYIVREGDSSIPWFHSAIYRALNLLCRRGINLLTMTNSGNNQTSWKPLCSRRSFTFDDQFEIFGFCRASSRNMLFTKHHMQFSVFVLCKKGKRKVQGVPQSQTAALLRPQEDV